MGLKAGLSLYTRCTEYAKALGKSHILQTAPQKLNLEGLKVCAADTFTKTSPPIKRFSKEEISKAYKEYARNPYINSYLRSGEALNEHSEELFKALKQGIKESHEITGTYIRCITPKRSLGPLNTPKDVEKYIFNNAGFTSTAPIEKASYARTFLCMDKGAEVIFDIKKPIKGYRAENGYEVLFDTNAFTPDKYQIIKTNPGVFKVVEKEQPMAKITSHYNRGQSLVLGYMPDDYVTKEHLCIKGGTYIPKIGPKKGQEVTVPDRWIDSSISLPSYHIDMLWSGGAGSGTKSVQQVVARSLEDPRTTGRVTLDACCIDGKTSPAGFYYKLGFRFQNQDLNIKLEEWLKNGGKRENAPFITGTMFLPKENIEQCLKYGKG